jgi:hypothetical protein
MKGVLENADTDGKQVKVRRLHDQDGTNTATIL